MVHRQSNIINSKFPETCRSILLHFILFFFVIINLKTVAANSPANILKTLPGYPGTLPFKLETGYISVGKGDEIQLFYYFIESERDPQRDPLIFWLTGGPGCSGFSGLVYEIGPLAFEVSQFNGSVPSLVRNPYSWTKISSIIFIDSPVGTGFSYSAKPEGYKSNDTKAAKDNYTFLRKWLLNHPKFMKNRLYVAGDSYGGKIVTMVTLEIAKGNEDGLEPRMNVDGYIIGNSRTDPKKDENERIPYAHRMGLISDEYYKEAKQSCRGEYVSPDPNNYQCLDALRPIKHCMGMIFREHILEPKCTSPEPNDIRSGRKMYLENLPIGIKLHSEQKETWCRRGSYWGSIVWANDVNVQKALQIRKGTVERWNRCKRIIALSYYIEDVESVLQHHHTLSQKGYQALIYSGDHDMVVPYTSTLKWIRTLNLTIVEKWRPWIVDSQVAGYTEVYRKYTNITFATVKGAGHTAPEYKPKQCLAMLSRWLSNQPL